MSSLEEIEDEIILQGALLDSLGDAGDDGQQRKAIDAKIKELEALADQLSATTNVNDDSSRQQGVSSRTSVASDDDDLPEHPMPGAWSDAASRKRPAEESASGSSKRLASEARTIPTSGPSMTAANRMERYRLAEEAARARAQRERQDAEFAASLDRESDTPTSSGRPSVDPRTLAPPFQRPTYPSLSPGPKASPTPSQNVKQEGSSSIIRPSPSRHDEPIDLTDDRVLPASWSHQVTAQQQQQRQQEQQRHVQTMAELNLRLRDLQAQHRTISARLASAQTLSTRWQSYHDQMEARGWPPGPQGDSDAMKRFTKEQVANSLTSISQLRRDSHMTLGQINRTQAELARPAPGIGSSRAAAAPNIYAPIKKEKAGGKKLSDWGPGLNDLMGSMRSVPQQEDPDQTDWFLPEIPDHYNIDADPRTDEQTAEDIQNMFDNMYQDDEAQLRAEEVELDSMTVNLKPYQGMGLNWLQRMEEGTNKGGILADDMGLGKTIQAIALMSTRRSEDPLCKTTLIIAPVALLRQWRQEIQDKLKRGRHGMSVFIHHGTTKKKTFEELRRFDVVLTTFGTLASEQRQYDRFISRKKQDRNAVMTPSEKGIFTNSNAHWYRVILDEAQNIKNKNTRCAQACCRLQTKYRLCMTGTPMMNSVDELYSLINFLRIPPYNSYKKFQKDFSKPLKSRGEEHRKSAMVKLQALIKATLLRRHKKTKMNGRPILILPERNVVEDPRDFEPEELDFYKAIELNSQTQFNKYVKAGSVGKQYAHILVLLLRLRQCCCHPHLVKDFGAVAAAAEITEDTMVDLAGKLDEAVIKRIKEKGGAFECPVCFEATENPAIFVPCGHDTCSDCFGKICEAARAEDGSRDAKCPNCRGKINTKSVVDYETFKKVHEPPPAANDAEPDPDEVETETEAEDDDDDDETESESGSEDDEDDASLDGFIVNDDEEDEREAEVDEDDIETASEAEEDAMDWTPADDGDLQPSGYTGPTGKATASKDKGKAPAVEKEARPARRSKKKSRGRQKCKKGKKGNAAEKDSGKKKKSGKKTRTLAELKKDSTKNKAAKKRYLSMIRKDWTSSSKIDATIEALSTIIKDTDEKVIVFSQWTSLLDLLEVPIDERGWGYERYDGSMNAKARADAVDNFKDNRSRIRIMLVSLKAGNAGLNLNTASRVIMLDPFWNPYIEEQAIDRAHRLGQTRDVNVQRLLIKETVEDRIMALQEKKRAMINEALDEGAGQRLSRLSQAELGFLFGVRPLNQ